MGSRPSSGQAWGSTAAVVVAGLVCVAAGLFGASVASSWTDSVSGWLFALLGVMVFASVAWRLHRGGWSTRAAEHAGHGWLQTLLIAGMFTGLVVTRLHGSAAGVGAVMTLTFALGVAGHGIAVSSRKSRTN